jgi:stringent starvation protein B
MLEWMVDCGDTPHLIVDATLENVQVPRQFVKEGRIVLNISASATQSFLIGAEAVEFSARFSGTSHYIRVPIGAVLGIYARETGQGMIFSDEENRPGSPPDDGGAPTPTPAPPAPQAEKRVRPTLKVVK